MSGLKALPCSAYSSAASGSCGIIAMAATWQGEWCGRYMECVLYGFSVGWTGCVEQLLTPMVSLSWMVHTFGMLHWFVLAGIKVLVDLVVAGGSATLRGGLASVASGCCRDHIWRWTGWLFCCWSHPQWWIMVTLVFVVPLSAALSGTM